MLAGRYTSLEKVRAIEERLEQVQAARARPSVSPDLFTDLHGELERAWNDADTDVRLKKRILRTLVEDVVVDIDEAASEGIAAPVPPGAMQFAITILPPARANPESTVTLLAVPGSTCVRWIESEPMSKPVMGEWMASFLSLVPKAQSMGK